MEASPFVGAWRLLSWELRDAAGHIDYPFGRDPIGYLIYTPDGYMSATLTPARRPHFAASDPLGGDVVERAAAAATCIAYAGPYEVQAGTILHHVEVSLFPNWIGSTQERHYAFSDDRLTLSTAPVIVSGLEQRAYLVWERATQR